MTCGRIARSAITAALALTICVTASIVESADFQARRSSPRVMQARYRMQAEPIESAESMPRDGEVIYEGMSPDEIEMYGEPMSGPYAAPPEGSFPYPKLYNVRPHRSHGSFAPQSHYFGYYPTRWRRFPEGWAGPKYQDAPSEPIPAQSEELPDPNMPAPGATPSQPTAEDEYGPTPGGQPAPGGMTPDAPTMLPDDQLPEQPMPLEDAPPLFPTDELDAPGLPSNGAMGLPADDAPAGDIPLGGGLPSDGLPGDDAMPSDVAPLGEPGDSATEIPELSPPPGLPTDTPPPGLPAGDSLPAPGGQFQDTPLDELPAPGPLDSPPPAEGSGDATRPGFSLHDDAPPRFNPQELGIRPSSPSARGPRSAETTGPVLGAQRTEQRPSQQPRQQGPRLSTKRPAPAVPHTASVAGHRGPAVNEFRGSATPTEYDEHQTANDNRRVEAERESQPSATAEEGPSLWPAPGQSHSPEPSNDEQPDGLNALPEDVQEAAPVNGYPGPGLPSFPQPGDTSQRRHRPQSGDTRWQSAPSSAPQRSQASSRRIDPAVRPAVNWSDEVSTNANVVASANQPLTNQPTIDQPLTNGPAEFGTNPLRRGTRAASSTANSTPPRRLPTNHRANPLR